MTTRITTPPGRIVWGNPLAPREKKNDQGQVVLKDGKPILEYQFGIAIPKAEFAQLGAVIKSEADGVSPQGIPADFAYKVKDGDTGLDRKGQPLSNKPGYAGCFILACSTTFPVPVYRRNEQNQFVEITQAGPKGLKTGDYARVDLTINGHGRAPGKMGAKPGLYLNANQVEFLGYGEEIKGASNPDDAFGQPVSLPQGASQTPTASGPFGGGQQAQTPAAPQPSFAPSPPVAPQSPPAPHQEFPWGGKS